MYTSHAIKTQTSLEGSLEQTLKFLSILDFNALNKVLHEFASSIRHATHSLTQHFLLLYTKYL